MIDSQDLIVMGGTLRSVGLENSITATTDSLALFKLKKEGEI